MKIGLLKEIKNNEYRVALTPATVATLCAQGHTLFVQTNAGVGSGFSDDMYQAQGAHIVGSAKDVFAEGELLLHVKEPQASEYGLLREHHMLFSYLHLAAEQELTDALVRSGATCIAFETIQTASGALPLLAPMSEVAGKMAVQAGAACLEKPNGGCGHLLGGVTGTMPATVLVIGGGVVGMNSAYVAAGMGATAYILDTNVDRLRYLREVMPANCIPLMSNPLLLVELLKKSQLVIGAVLIAGANAPKVITDDMLQYVAPGTVFADVAIDQGGCFSTSKPTTHATPTFMVDDIVHYCVSNIPGAVPVTSTNALNNALLPYLLKLAGGGIDAVRNDPDLQKGVNCMQGKITYSAVAEAFSYQYTPLDSLI